MEWSDHFFRRESGRIVAALIKIFGVHNLDLAEDVTQDAFFRAFEDWKRSGEPPNPSAWLMLTAKNRALDILRRERTARRFAPEYGRLLESEWTLVPTLHELLEPEAIKDDQLRVMFSCCDQRLPEESQVALILNILCGFSVNETASAFVSTHAAMEKRIIRAKKVLATSNRLFEITERGDFVTRLPAVHRALYLLFNEGYHGASSDNPVRVELCHEAIRLARMLHEHPFGATPVSAALVALMLLHAARLPARISSTGDLTSLMEQDRSLWDQQFIADGAQLLKRSASGTELSEYHVEAMIAFLHSQARQPDETNWNGIVELYDLLMTLRPSPIVALNRAIAVAQVQGPERGLEEVQSITNLDRLQNYPFYWAAMGEMEFQIGNSDKARDHFASALAIARNPAERRYLELRIHACNGSLSFHSSTEFRPN